MGWQALPGRTGPHTAGHPNNLPSWYPHHPGAGSGRWFLLGAHVSIPKPGTCLGQGGEPDLAPAVLQSPATSFPAAGAGSLNGRSPPHPEAAQRVIFHRESIVLASVLQTALRRVCYQSWAALINLVCEAVFSALVNVRYYLPESLL